MKKEEWKDGKSQKTDDDETVTVLTDTPLTDRMWDGLLAWMTGTFAVCAAATACPRSRSARSRLVRMDASSSMSSRWATAAR